MSITKDKLKEIRNETCERTNCIIEEMKKKYGFNKLSLGSQKDFINHIQEGLMDAADIHNPGGSPD